MSASINSFENTGWAPAEGYNKGLLKKILHQDDRITTFLLRCDKGAMVDRTSHTFTEEHLIILGKFRVDGQEIGEGTFRHLEPGEFHGPFECIEPVLVLVTFIKG